MITEERQSRLEKINPYFRAQQDPEYAPGKVLAADTYYIGYLKEGLAYLHAVVDTYGSYAFGVIFPSSRSEDAVALLERAVLPFYLDRTLQVDAIITDSGREFCHPKLPCIGPKGGGEPQARETWERPYTYPVAPPNRKPHPYEAYLKRIGVEHQRLPDKSQGNPVARHFFDIVRMDLFDMLIKELRQSSLYVIKFEFDKWIIKYNTERLYDGDLEEELTPIEMIDSFVNQTP